MFFSTYVLTKKGPLAKVWLAAHWDKRLTRNEVRVVDLSQTILHIVRPVVPIALRTSGELLVGVVRIYALKVKHLLKEATEATLFLRVTTLATKGSRSTLSDPQQQQQQNSSSGANSRTTAIDGVLVPLKGDLEAVTFDWDAEMAAKHGSAKDAAEALGEGRFDAIADLLGSGRRIEGAAEKEDGLLASAWYTVQPTSQAAEELHSTQQDYDEIAKMRADLMALGGERGSGSASTSKSKSSLASMEKGRGSMALGDANGLPYAAMGDELDIGVPLPDELPLGFPGMDGADVSALPADPFLLPDVMTADDDAVAAGRLSRAARKPRVVNVLDLASTTLSREAFEKCIADRSDVLNSEPRRGPYDAQEESDRYAIAGVAQPADADAAAAASTTAEAVPLSTIAGSALRGVFAAALQRSVEAAARASQPLQAGRRSDGLAGAVAGAEEDFHNISAAALEEGEGENGGKGSRLNAMEVDGETAGQRAARKRGRGEDEEAEGGVAGLSTSALQTMARLRAEMSRRVAAQSRKKTRTELPPAALVGATCTVQEVCQSLRRRDAARTFVDVLALASKQFVTATQAREMGDVTVQMNESAVSLFATA